MNVAAQFAKEAYYELRKSSWLSRKEAGDSTKAVVMLVIIFSIYVAAIDFVLSIILGSIMGRP